MVLTLLIIAAFGGELLCVEMETLPSLSPVGAYVGGLINGISIVSVDFLYSTLKVVTKPLDTKHKKAAFPHKEN